MKKPALHDLQGRFFISRNRMDLYSVLCFYWADAMAEVDRVAGNEGLKRSLRKYAIESGAIKEGLPEQNGNIDCKTVGMERKSETEGPLRKAMEAYKEKKFVAKSENTTVGILPVLGWRRN